MKKRKRIDRRHWTPFEKGYLTPEQLNRSHTDEVWMNNRYQVNVTWDSGGMIQLSIKKRSKAIIDDWRDLQRIKNEVLGPEYEAVQLFPAESRLIDTSNQYHLWCLPAGCKFKFGYNEGRVVTDHPGENAKQRPGIATPEDEARYQSLVDASQLEVKKHR